MKKLIPVLAVLFAAAAMAQVSAPPKPQPTPNDFASQIPLQVSGQNGVVQFTLPLTVYQRAQNADLADVRVFSTSGALVPFAFAASNAGTMTAWRETAAKIFPVQAEPTINQGNFELDVRAAQDGAVLAVHAKQVGKTQSTGLQALVLDLGVAQKETMLDSLQFFLPANVSSYRAELAVEQSADLKLWNRVAQSRVDWLQGAGPPNEPANRLVNDRIELAAHGGRYMRIRWTEGAPLQFTSIVARWRTTLAAADNTLQVELTGKNGRFPGDWIYAANPALAAYEIGLDLPTANTVAPASIGYYRQQPAPKREWQFIPITNNTFYRLTQNGTERTSSRIHIYPLALTEWVVRPQNQIEPAPKLVLRLKPRTVIFTAQGNSREFVLAFGAGATQLKQWSTSETSLSQVAPGFSASELDNLEQATLGDARPSRPADESQPINQSTTTNAFNNRTLILWGVLIVGTLLLAGMTWRLVKQLQSSARK